MVPDEGRLEDTLVPVEVEVPPLTPERVPAVDDDLTDCPAFGLEALETAVMDDLEAPDAEEDLVAVDLVVAAPLLDLVMDELLEPAVLDTEPIPFLETEPVVEILGL